MSIFNDTSKALILFNELNRFYFTSFLSSFGCVIVTDEKKIFIAASRKNQEFPIFIWKRARPHLSREKTAADFIRKNYLNTCVDDIHEMISHNDRLGNVIDNTLKYHQLFSVRTSTLKMYTDNKDDQLILYTGKVHSHGVNHNSMSSRATAENLEISAKRQSDQIGKVLDSKTPTAALIHTPIC